LTEVRGTLREQTVELNAVSDKAMEKLENLSQAYRREAEGLATAAEESAGRARDAGSVFETQVDQLLKAAGVATEQAERVRAAAVSAQQDTFLKAATFIIETLQSIAVDLNRILDEEIPDYVWKRFHAGERAVFTRHLLRLQERGEATHIRKKFEEDPNFRDFVLRYLNQFETLLEQARDSDHQDVLGATFVTADVGKLYLLLSNAVGRLKQ
jgi:hypothetical protein